MKPAVERFWAKVDRNGSCWLWRGATNGTGHGRFILSQPRRTVQAHRFAYELVNGPIPADQEIHHLCADPRCVRPSHLAAVTRLEHRQHHRKTHCPHGHVYDEQNTRVGPNGKRVCRACEREFGRGRRPKAVAR